MRERLLGLVSRFPLREVLLAVGLAVGCGVVVRGVAMLHEPTATILAGVFVVALTVLFLAEAD